MIRQICGIDVTMTKLHVSKQKNTYDCGICMLLSLLKLMHFGVVQPNLKISYKQNEIDSFRHWFICYFLEWCEFTQNETQIIGHNPNTVINVDD
jgi:hypothetical protein